MNVEKCTNFYGTYVHVGEIYPSEYGDLAYFEGDNIETSLQLSITEDEARELHRKLGEVLGIAE